MLESNIYPFWAEQQQVAIPGWLRQDKKRVALRGTFCIEKTTQMSNN
jgi:hypothetical protein